MNLRFVPLVDPPKAMHWWQELAAAVLRQAISDATIEPHPVKRAQVRAWLTGSQDARWWCGVAGLPADVVVDEIRRRLNQPSLPAISDTRRAGFA